MTPRALKFLVHLSIIVFLGAVAIALASPGQGTPSSTNPTGYRIVEVDGITKIVRAPEYSVVTGGDCLGTNQVLNS
ncbi:MAG: hypothetical protein Q3972_03730 [Corynebacterium sp.]|nr:hypothetical protein [Corynebacterium sp.]